MVATPATTSGRRLRENVRFTLWGPRGAPIDKCRGRFGTRRYVLRCDEATDAVLLVGALRALTNPKPGPPSRRLARSKSGAIVDESRAGVHDDLMRVPGKPLGFLAASTIEYHPARPEAHRSTVLAGQKLHSSRPPKPRELPVKVSLRHK